MRILLDLLTTHATPTANPTLLKIAYGFYQPGKLKKAKSLVTITDSILRAMKIIYADVDPKNVLVL